MRRQIPPDPAALNRRPSVVEANPGVGSVVVTFDGASHRLAPSEARALARALLAGALVADNRFDDRDLDFDDELAEVT